MGEKEARNGVQALLDGWRAAEMGLEHTTATTDTRMRITLTIVGGGWAAAPMILM